ncbi:hypothetical protein [Mycobacteroides abscessus]|uniref:hypothetical protein n=1 Tax=Mycobacteroides abscessus TaxID=36809 RepID=UPI00092B14FF|nr:hypothetical protein [Mycobacteroides abscessus]SIL62182.1 Uncharacterised protein [Mycobacteroides abscessus subsp. abscessus]
MGIAYTPARSASIEYKAKSGTIPCSAVATSARQNEWTISIGDVHRFILSGNRSKAEELVQAYGELYDCAFPAPVKPRELQTLDCEEARDGSTWQEDTAYAWRYRYVNGAWCVQYNPDVPFVALVLDGDYISEFYMNNIGPYTEVVE